MHKDTRVFLTHFLHLSFLRAVSRVLPLVTVPFFMRTIGVEQYGTIEFVKALSFYFTPFVTYGFKYSATKQINLYKQDKATVGQVLGAVYTIKLTAIAICCCIVIGLIFFVPSIQQDRVYLLSFFPVVVASSLFPTFVFQGLEKIRWLTLINLIAKILFLVGVFTLIRQPTDALLYPILLAISDIVRLAVAFYILYYVLGISISLPTRAMVGLQLKEGAHIFFSQLSIILYARLPMLFLRFSVGPKAVAIYSLGDKMIRTTVGMVDPFTQALYPTANRKLAENRSAGLGFIMRVSIISIAALGMIGACYWVFAGNIVQLLAGKPMQDAVAIFRLHAFLPCIVILSNILGIAVLVPIQAGGKYTLTMLMTGLLCLGLHFILVPRLQAQGAAWAILLCEVFATVMMAFWVYRQTKMQQHIPQPID